LLTKELKKFPVSFYPLEKASYIGIWKDMPIKWLIFFTKLRGKLSIRLKVKFPPTNHYTMKMYGEVDI
jgi:hypothetical protein